MSTTDLEKAKLLANDMRQYIAEFRVLSREYRNVAAWRVFKQYSLLKKMTLLNQAFEQKYEEIIHI